MPRKKFTGTNQTDRLWGTIGSDEMFCVGGNDVANGNGGSDLVWGGMGNDQLTGGEDKDTLHGGAGNDQLFGGIDADAVGGDGGDDTIQGGPGGDRLWGGVGRDVFVFKTGDSDPIRGIDTIYDMDENLVPVSDPLGPPKFEPCDRLVLPHHKGIRYASAENGYVLICCDINGDNNYTDLQIVIRYVQANRSFATEIDL